MYAKTDCPFPEPSVILSEPRVLVVPGGLLRVKSKPLPLTFAGSEPGAVGLQALLESPLMFKHQSFNTAAACVDNALSNSAGREMTLTTPTIRICVVP